MATDPRIEPVARLLCEQAGDRWTIGRALWLNLAREVLAAADAADPVRRGEACDAG